MIKMKTGLMNEGLVIAVILLFIGVSIAPSINFNVVKASNDNDLVEVTTQACGIKGYGNTTVKLTTQQYQNLEQYLVEFRARLNQTTTREEAVPIFKDAVVELNKYGLLPKGMSVERAQELVTGENQIFQDNEVINKLYNNHKQMIDENTNIFCLFAGQTDNTFVVTFLLRLLFIPLLVIGYIVMSFEDFPILYKFLTGLLRILIVPIVSSPIGFNQWISYGYNILFPYNDLIPTHGWIYTNGFNGVKTWNGSFIGAINYDFSFIFYFGTFDFTGISLYLPIKQQQFCLGTALMVKLTDY